MSNVSFLQILMLQKVTFKSKTALEINLRWQMLHLVPILKTFGSLISSQTSYHYR